MGRGDMGALRSCRSSYLLVLLLHRFPSCSTTDSFKFEYSTALTTSNTAVSLTIGSVHEPDSQHKTISVHDVSLSSIIVIIILA